MKHHIFDELSLECGMTTQMFAEGLEKKEIAVLKCKAVPTINNQLQTSYLKLKVRNRSELTKLYCKRIIEKGLTALLMICLMFAPAYRMTRRSRARRGYEIECIYENTTEYVIT